MKEAIKRLEKAYARLSTILLNGDNVDIMAMAKQEIRETFVLMEEKAKAEEGAAKEEMKVDGEEALI